jgi:hypothetical protein
MGVNEFGEIVREDRPTNVQETDEEPTVHLDVYIGKQVEAVCKALALSPKVVYIPGSSTDVLPILEELKNSNILYADINDRAVRNLRKAGYNAILADIETIMPPEEVDLMVLNGISVNKPLDTMKKGGIVYSDGRMGSAENIAQNHEDFSLIGIVIDEEIQGTEGSQERELMVKKDGLDFYYHNLRRTEEELAEVRRNLRMQLMNGTSSSQASEPLLPAAKGYIFQKNK